MRVGIAGTGRMGTAFAQRLLVRGHEVRVWNRTVEHAGEARAAGAIWTSTLVELANASEAVISSMLDDAAVERLYLSGDGLLSGNSFGRLFIDMSTVSPGAHDRTAAAMALRRADFLECPVSGSISTARSGMLVGFAGGEDAAFVRGLSLLSDLCRRVEHVGALGAGARMKLAANLLLTVFWQSLGEALVLVDTGATGTARAIDLLADSNISAGILRARAVEIIAALEAKTSGAAAFDVDTMRKDLRYMTQEAAAQGASLPLASRTLECFDRASRRGDGGVDGVAYPGYWIAQQKAAAKITEMESAA